MFFFGEMVRQHSNARVRRQGFLKGDDPQEGTTLMFLTDMDPPGLGPSGPSHRPEPGHWNSDVLQLGGRCFVLQLVVIGRSTDQL